MGKAARDVNRVPTLIGVSSVDGTTPTLLEVDPSTGELLVKSSISGTLPLPTGASTSAKQDTLLTELQLKADLTETQPVSLATVPSHAVTNAGTFAVQSTHTITGIADGRTVVTTAGTRVVLAASTACKKVDIVAETDNTGIIVVGGTSVVAALATRQGVPLNAGDSYSLEIDNLNDVYLDSTVSTDGVTYVFYT